MAIVATNVPINSQGICPDPDAIISEIKALDLIVYELVPAGSGDDISDWIFELFLKTKGAGAGLPLTLGLPGGRFLSALVLPALPLGSHEVDLKIRNLKTGDSVLIDPKIIRRPG